MIRMSPTVRVSFGLVLLNISIIIGAQILGLLPDPDAEALDKRKKLSEVVGVYCSSSAQKGDLESIQTALETIVQRNSELLSIAVRRDGDLLVKTAGHSAHWQNAPIIDSSATHVRVPIQSGDVIWGDTELIYRPLKPTGLLSKLWSYGILRLILFFALVGFFAYRFFMKRTLRALDPSSVIPPRVKATLDALVEGVILIDKDEHIVMANSAFVKMCGRNFDSLIGTKASELDWMTSDSREAGNGFPWKHSLKDAESQTGIRICLAMPDETTRTFIANTVPILDGSDNSRGVLATFDDVTIIEAQNEKLQKLNKALEDSNNKVCEQNRSLTILATHDPLTGCLNRRAFFKQLNTAFASAMRHGHTISCVMLDVDHFKSINDRHGHAFGDYVLKELAELLKAELRTDDSVGRYGGEEFCLLLPHTDNAGAAQLADRLRSEIENHDFNGIQVTVSIGVADMQSEAASGTAVVDCADKALYVAKTGGRNRVIQWGGHDVQAA